jgi:hypothetical protein
MINSRNSGIGSLLTGSAVQIWTLVTLADDRISCTIHSSEYHAYREAVSRFESAEHDGRREDPQLHFLLEDATTRGDYHEVRKYIEANSCRLHLMQLGEHDVNDLGFHPLRAPQLVQSSNPVGRN